MLKITGLDHVGLLVTDMDKTLDFYRRLGLEVLRTSGADAKGVRSAVMKVGGQELASARLVGDPGLDERDGRRRQGNNRAEGCKEERDGEESEAILTAEHGGWPFLEA